MTEKIFLVKTKDLREWIDYVELTKEEIEHMKLTFELEEDEKCKICSGLLKKLEKITKR